MTKVELGTGAKPRTDTNRADRPPLRGRRGIGRHLRSYSSRTSAEGHVASSSTAMPAKDGPRGYQAVEFLDIPPMA